MKIKPNPDKPNEAGNVIWNRVNQCCYDALTDMQHALYADANLTYQEGSQVKFKGSVAQRACLQNLAREIFGDRTYDSKSSASTLSNTRSMPAFDPQTDYLSLYQKCHRIVDPTKVSVANRFNQTAEDFGQLFVKDSQKQPASAATQLFIDNIRQHHFIDRPTPAQQVGLKK